MVCTLASSVRAPISRHHGLPRALPVRRTRPESGARWDVNKMDAGLQRAVSGELRPVSARGHGNCHSCTFRIIAAFRPFLPEDCGLRNRSLPYRGVENGGPTYSWTLDLRSLTKSSARVFFVSRACEETHFLFCYSSCFPLLTVRPHVFALEQSVSGECAVA